MQGTKVFSLSRNNISNTLISYPNLAEQTAIATTFQNLDRTITTKKEQHEKTKNIKKALLTKMFPQNGAKVPEVRCAGFSGEWNEERFVDLGKSFTGLSGKTKEDFGHGEAEYITYMNVFSNYISNIYATDKTPLDKKQFQVKYGDVLFTTSSEIPEEVGMSSVWLSNKENVYLNSFCFGVRLGIEVDYIFISYLLRSDFIRKQIVLLAQGATRFNISKIKVMDITILLPTLEEQTSIATIFQNIYNLLQSQTAELYKLENIKKALLAKMFV